MRPSLLFSRHSLLFRRSSSPLAAADSLTRFVRYFTVYTLRDSVYKSPWDRPDPECSGAVVTHLDASPDKKGQSGGAVAWITRDSYGDTLDQGSKWISGVSDPTELEWRGFVEYTSTKPRVGLHHTICNDNAGVVLRLKDMSEGSIIENPKMKKWATVVWNQLQANFPRDTVIKYVPREGNSLADAKAHFARLEHLEKVAMCS